VQYKGSELNPLFYGEISSTHLFYDIFDKHHETAKAFVDYFFKIKTTCAFMAPAPGVFR
jgi:hypothetical protein